MDAQGCFSKHVVGWDGGGKIVEKLDYSWLVWHLETTTATHHKSAELLT